MFYAGTTSRWPDAPCEWNEHVEPVYVGETSRLLTEVLKGVLLLVIFVSLLTIPVQMWLPAEVAMDYCLQSLAAMSWLWLAMAPFVTLAVWLAERYFTQNHH